MTIDEVEKNLKQAMLTVMTSLSDGEIWNLAIIEDCCYCPKCMRAVCPKKDPDHDGVLFCELAWINAAEKIKDGQNGR